MATGLSLFPSYPRDLSTAFLHVFPCIRTPLPATVILLPPYAIPTRRFFPTTCFDSPMSADSAAAAARLSPERHHFPCRSDAVHDDRRPAAVLLATTTSCAPRVISSVPHHRSSDSKAAETEHRSGIGRASTTPRRDVGEPGRRSWATFPSRGGGRERKGAPIQ